MKLKKNAAFLISISALSLTSCSNAPRNNVIYCSFGSSNMGDLQAMVEMRERQPIDDVSMRVCIGYNHEMKYNFERKKPPITKWNYTFLYQENIYDENGRLLWSSSRFIDDFFPSEYYYIDYYEEGESPYKNFSTRKFDFSKIGEFTSGHICFTLAYYNKDTGSVLCGASGMYGAYGLDAASRVRF